jgi:hypothetical protein
MREKGKPASSRNIRDFRQPWDKRAKRKTRRREPILHKGARLRVSIELVGEMK